MMGGWRLRTGAGHVLAPGHGVRMRGGPLGGHVTRGSQPQGVLLLLLLLLLGAEDGLHDVLGQRLRQLRQRGDQLIRLHGAGHRRARAGLLVGVGERGVEVGGVHVLEPHVLGDAAQVEVAAHAQAAVRALLPVVGLARLACNGDTVTPHPD